MALTWTGDLAQRAEDFHDTMLKGDRSEQFEELREFLHTAALAADGPFVPRDLIAEMNQRIWPPARVPRQLIKDACATLNRHGIHYDGVMLHPPGNTASTGTLPESVPTPSPMRAAPRASTSPSIRTQPPIRTAPSLRAPRPPAPQANQTLATATMFGAGTAPTGTWMGTVGPGTHPEGSILAGQLDLLQPGGILKGRRLYELEEKVGQGGMGQVWRAKTTDNLGPQGLVAIKTVKAPTPAHVAALLREVVLLRELKRADYFPAVHEDIRANGQVFLVMDWVEGRNLQQLVVDDGVTAVDRTLFLMLLRQIADRLSYLHSWQPRPIVFRDLKPSNVMLARGTQRVRLVDFGISHLASSDDNRQNRAGTPGYMAPETKNGQATEASDIYALGRTALFLLFGNHQFSKINARSRPPAWKARGLGTDVVKAALQLCVPNPNLRPVSAVEAFTRIEAATAGPVNAGSHERLDDLWGAPCRACGRSVIAERVYCSWCGADQDAQRAKRRSPGLADIQKRPNLFGTAPAAPSSRLMQAWHDLARIRSSADLGTLQCLPYIDVQPYDYQRAAATRVLSRMNGRAMIADDVGLGKTIEGGLVIKEYLHRGLARKVLIVCPPGLLLKQLQQEMEEKFRLKFLEYKSGGDKTPGDKLVGPQGLAKADLVIVSFTMLRGKKHGPKFKKIQWDMLLVDECHHLKSRKTQTYKAIRSLVTRYVLFMSATPFSGKNEELWTVYSAIRPGYLGATKEDFSNRGFYDKKPPPELRQRIRDMTIRRRRQDLLVRFPKRQPVMVSAEPDASYERAKKIVASATANKTKFARLIHLQQLASSYESLMESKLAWTFGQQDRQWLRALHDEEHPKVRTLLERVVPRIPKDEKVVVFARFRASQRALARLLAPQGGSLPLIQATTGKKKQEMLSRFRDGPERFLICGEGAGEGLNLQFASVMVNMDLPWNPMRLEQRIGRIQRLGQRRKRVTVVTIVVKNSVEERVYEVLEKKLLMFSHVIGETEQILGRLFDKDNSQSFERWLAEVLTQDLDADVELMNARNRDIEKATRAADLDLKEGGRSFDRLFGDADPLAAGDAPMPDQEPIDLSFLEDDD